MGWSKTDLKIGVPTFSRNQRTRMTSSLRSGGTVSQASSAVLLASTTRFLRGTSVDTGKKRRRKMVQLNFGSHSIFLTGTRLSNHRSMSVTLVTRRLQGSVSSPQSGARGCKVQEETVWEHLKTCRRISSSASINQQTHCHCVTREREGEGGADTKEARRALSQKENTRWPKLFCLLLLFPRKRRPPPPRLSASWFPPSLSPSAIMTAAGRHKSAAAGLSRSSVRGVPVSILA